MSAPAAPTEPAPGAGVTPPPARARRRLAHRRPIRPARGARELWWPTLLLAGIVCFVTFYAKGGLNLESLTTTEVALTLGAGAVVAAAVIRRPAAKRVYGSWSVGLLLAFSALSALSVVWSVQPDDSWHDAGRLLAYSAVFAAAVALVRLKPERWPAILGGLALAAVVVCGYALLTKVFPGKLAAANTYARLEEPFGYWNAIGLTAALGAICCMWLGARRAGHALLSALAYPAMGLLLLTLLLAYSRGALAALAIGLVLWFCIVPLRLRGAAVLILGGLGAGAVAAWDFSRHALSAENVALGERASAGHELGALLLAMILALTIAGVAIGFITARRAPSLDTRRRAGTTLLVLLVLAVVGFAGALAHSHRGLSGSVSHAVNALTNPNAKPPPNTPGRLTAVASVRARYWKEGLEIFDAHPVLGAGAEGYGTARLRYRHETLEVRHAHGFVVQTLADLGLVGLALALALLLTWMAAAGRATHPFNRRWRSWSARRETRSRTQPGRRPEENRQAAREPYTPERIGMLSMLCLVVVFGVHSLVDWTWYVPGDACVALLCAGWLAGRGPLGAASGEGLASREPGTPGRQSAGYVRVALAALAIVGALLAVWSESQPQRSVDASQQALAQLAGDPKAALPEAQTGVARDPLSAQALFVLATVQQANGESAGARATLVRAVRLQPSNPETWLRLGKYELERDPRAALRELEAGIYLDPESIAPEAIAEGHSEAIEIQNDYIEALRASAAVPRRAAPLRSKARA
ncbi:MAG: O-antigen ligase family protein [Solirubrobacteraceae bacterium]